MHAAEADGAEHTDLPRALADRAHDGEEHDQRLDGDDDADDGVGEPAELVDGVLAALDGLLQGRDLGLRQRGADLAGDAVHGAPAYCAAISTRVTLPGCPGSPAPRRGRRSADCRPASRSRAAHR